MMTFFKEAFQVNRKSYPEHVRSALFHAIKKTAANLDACVKVPGKDFSRKRKLPLQTMLLMLIGMGGGSLSKELYDWFGYTPSTATASAFVQQRNKIRSRRISRKNGAAQREKVRCPGALGVGRIHPRELKYTIELSCLHGKKTDFLLQEVFARLILYNYASLIAWKIPVPQEKQINFSVSILVCKQFLKGKIRSAQIFGILSKHLSSIRPRRQYKRYQNPVSAVAFQYRFS